MKNKKFNIAIFSPNQKPYSETFIQAHKKYLKGNIFYYYGRGERIQLEGQERLMPLFRYKLLRAFAKLLRKSSEFLFQEQILFSLKTHKIDVILVEYGNHAHQLKNILKTSNLPVVVHFHGYDASEKEVIKSTNKYKEVFEFSKKIIAVSRVMENTLLNMGCPKKKLVYNVYGPRPEFFDIKPLFCKKQFVAVGRFTNKKAPFYTILAFRKVLEKYPNVHLLFAGEGILKESCEHLTKYFAIDNNVHFLGVISAEKYKELLGESLAFIQHSITAANGDMEGTPLAILEASAAGIPVVATRHAGIPDVIVDKKTGLLNEEHDIDGMIKNMLQLLGNQSEAEKMGAAGKDHIRKFFSLERHIEMLQDILKNVAN